MEEDSGEGLGLNLNLDSHWVEVPQEEEKTMPFAGC